MPDSDESTVDGSDSTNESIDVSDVSDYQGGEGGRTKVSMPPKREKKYFSASKEKDRPSLKVIPVFADSSDEITIVDDVDSVCVVATGLEAFRVSQYVDVSVAKSKVYPEKNWKTYRVLEETLVKESLVTDAKDCVWMHFRFGGYNRDAIYVLLLMKAGHSRVEGVGRTFMRETLKSVGTKLPPTSQTRQQNICTFLDTDERRGIKIFEKDWPLFCEHVNEQLSQNTAFCQESKVLRIFYYKCSHGMQDRSSASAMDIFYELGINVDSPKIVLAQLHVANTILAEEGRCILIEQSGIQRLLSSSGFRLGHVNKYYNYFIADCGFFTAQCKYKEKRCVTYIQTYNPAIHILTKNRKGLFATFALLGGYNSKYCKSTVRYRKLRNDALGRMHDLEEFLASLERGVSLRIEVVYSASTVAELVTEPNVLGVTGVTDLLLQNHLVLVVKDGWQEYVRSVSRGPLSLVKSVLDTVQAKGLYGVVRKDIENLHVSETVLQCFLNSCEYKNYDYELASKLTEDGRIRYSRLTKHGSDKKLVRVRKDPYEGASTAVAVASSSTKEKKESPLRGRSRFSRDVEFVKSTTDFNLYRRGHYDTFVPYLAALIYNCLPSKKGDVRESDEKENRDPDLSDDSRNRKKMFISNVLTCVAVRFCTSVGHYGTLAYFDNAFNKERLLRYLKLRKWRQRERVIEVDGTIHKKDIIDFVAFPSNSKRQLLSSVLLTHCSAEGSIEDCLRDVVETFDVFPLSMFQQKMPVWNNIFKDVSHIPDPSSHESGRIVAARNLSQFRSKITGRGRSVLNLRQIFGGFGHRRRVDARNRQLRSFTGIFAGETIPQSPQRVGPVFQRRERRIFVQSCQQASVKI